MRVDDAEPGAVPHNRRVQGHALISDQRNRVAEKAEGNYKGETPPPHDSQNNRKAIVAAFQRLDRSCPKFASKINAAQLFRE
jgi:hypothetical protein